MDASDSIEQITHATKGDVEEGASAFRTPAPSSAKRRRTAGRVWNQGKPTPRPTWAPTKKSNSRKGLSDFGERLICEVHDSLVEMMKGDASPLLRNAD